MQSHKLFILLATLIAIGHFGSEALNCAGTGPSETITCSGTNIQVKCFVKIEDNGSVTRGCDINNNCNPPNCLSCTTDNCNMGLVCKQCNGDDPECATTDASAATYNHLCAFGEQCVNTVDQNGILSRGCGQPNACGSNNNPTCQACAGNVCNVGIFPKDRRECYHCSGNSCETLVNATMLKPCAVYQAEGQQCYMIGTSPTDIQRGCRTDLGEANKCGVGASDPNCFFCDSGNGCNNNPYQRELGSCYKCNDNSTCVGEQSGDSTKCAPVDYTQTVQSCYTQIFSNGTVWRGCTNELTGGCNANENCIACSGDNCNGKESNNSKPEPEPEPEPEPAPKPFSCIVCRSDYYEPCRRAEYGAEECSESSQTGPDASKCFSGEWDGIVVRGCLGDASDLMKYQCNDNKDDRCEVCSESGCNKRVYNGASASVQQLHLGVALVGAMIIVMRQYV